MRFLRRLKKTSLFLFFIISIFQMAEYLSNELCSDFLGFDPSENALQRSKALHAFSRAMVRSRSVLCSVRHHCASAALFLSSNITFRSPDTKPSCHALNRFVPLLPMVIKPPVSLTNPTHHGYRCAMLLSTYLGIAVFLLLILGVLASLSPRIFLRTRFLYPVIRFSTRVCRAQSKRTL